MATESIGNNLVAIRLRQLGDVLATLDALRALKEAQPQRQITYVVDEQFHPLLANEWYIDRLLSSPPRDGGWQGTAAMIKYVRSLRKLRPTVVLDFHSNPRSALITLLSGAKIRVGFDVKVRKVAYNIVEPRAGYRDGRIVPWNSAESALRLARHANTGTRTEASLPELVVDGSAVERGRELLVGVGVPADALGGGKVAGVNPGLAYHSKAWPEGYFVELAQKLVERGKQVVVLWGPGEEEAARRIAAAAGGGVCAGPKTDLAELPGLLRNLSYVVTIDSGLKHLAVCARVPTITIFGSTSPLEWHIGTSRDRFLWRGYSCSPCRLLECPYGAPCMADVRPRDVLERIDRLYTDGGDP